ncbi:unnamed protein product [Ilex paraguariensis]|uniref:Cytochrome P450 n=1 Tax=Ilex paraguariensis TaxID=185542 RepID=A0ABC8U4S3_9AQUA
MEGLRLVSGTVYWRGNGANHVDDHGANVGLCTFSLVLDACLGFSTANGWNSGKPGVAVCRREFLLHIRVFKCCWYLQLHREETSEFMTGREAAKILLTGKDGMVSLNLFYSGKQFINTLAIETLDQWPRRTILILEEASTFTLKVIHDHELRAFRGGARKSPSQFQNNFFLICIFASEYPGNCSSTSQYPGNCNLNLYSKGMLLEMALRWYCCIKSGTRSDVQHKEWRKLPTRLLRIPDKKHSKDDSEGDDDKLTDTQLKDNILTLLVAGHDTTTAALTWLIKFLDEKPAVLERLRVILLRIPDKKHSKDDSEGDDDKLTDTQLKDNILTLLVAGHDTTTAALTWLIKFLDENPAVLERLREEHGEILGTRKNRSCLSWSELNNMPYTSKVSCTLIKFCLSYQQTHLCTRNSANREFVSFFRKAAQDFEIDVMRYKIRKGWSINWDVVCIHHDPEIFPDPQKFDPSRFDEPMKPFSFLGFGNGPRMCPGINLAKLEISVFIHHLVCKYNWRPLEKDDSVHPTLIRMQKNKYPTMVEQL